MNPSMIELDAVLGPGEGETAERRARHSRRVYVRSIDQLAEASADAKGRRLTAAEAFDAYGWDVLRQVHEEGAALLATSVQSAGAALRRRRDLLGLTHRSVALNAGLPETIVQACENSRRLPVRQYERVARALGLDERDVSYRAEPAGNSDLAVRLRTIGDDMPAMTSQVVAALAEAAWVALQQVRLESLLFGARPPQFGIESNFGTSSSPAFRVGYQLARQVRDALELGAGPIPSLRELSEEHLGIPVIQSELGEHIAGVTLEVEGRRAIVLNLGSKNRNVFVRRATLAHELGHLLFDPRRQLALLRVDDYDSLFRPAEELRDVVEQRANAFAVELIAPQRTLAELYGEHGDRALAMSINLFGISATAARYQLWNALGRSVAFEALRAGRIEPEAQWDGAERYTVDYHPLPRLRASRAGRFGAMVTRAAEAGLISWDTAGEWLESDETEVRAAALTLRELFPTVWDRPLRE